MLESHPGVHQAAVFGVPSRVMGELVGAAVTLRPEVTAQVGASWGGMGPVHSSKKQTCST